MENTYQRLAKQIIVNSTFIEKYNDVIEVDTLILTRELLHWQMFSWMLLENDTMLQKELYKLPQYDKVHSIVYKDL